MNKRISIFRYIIKYISLHNIKYIMKPKTRKTVPKRYIPTQLSIRDKRMQREMLKKSRKQYKQGKYYTRKRVPGFKSKESQHIKNARRMYGVNKIVPSDELSRKSGCSVDTLNAIVKKGQGAYFSSGSRPNQTGHSWGYARMASAITGGKSAAVDFTLLENGCKTNSQALKLAKNARRKHGYGTRKVKRVKL